MRRIGGLSLLVLGFGCFFAAVVLAPKTCLAEITAASTALILLGSVLAFCAVSVPWYRYVRADGGQVGPFEYCIGIIGGLVVAAVPTLIVWLIIAPHNSCS